MARRIALLRAVNVGGRKVVMAELRAACEAAGFADVSTYIASGNLLFAPRSTPAEEEAELEQVIARVFGIAVPVIVRAGEAWPGYLRTCPMPDVARAEPNRLLMLLPKQPPLPDALDALAARALAGERLALAGDALWIHYADGVGTTKLLPNVIDRALGSPATGRNHNTVVKLAEMAAAGTSGPSEA